jgi:ribose transport system substrate-binding protein
MKAFIAGFAAIATVLVSSNLMAAQTMTIPVIVKNTSVPFWQAVFAGACTAGKKYGVTVPRLGASSEADMSGQIGIFENAVSGKPSAVVITPVSAEALGPAIDEAAARLPVVVADTPSNSKKVAATVMTDNVAAGRLGADTLAQEIQRKYGKAEGQVAILQFLPGVKSVQDRVDGFKDQMAKKYPGIKVVTTRIGDGSVTNSLNTTLDVLSTFPQLRGIFGDTFYSGLGAGQGIAETHAKDRVMGVTVDSTDELVKLVRSGDMKAMIVQDPFQMGDLSIEAAVRKVKGEKVNTFIDTGAHVIRSADLDTPEGKRLLSPDLSCR